MSFHESNTHTRSLPTGDKDGKKYMCQSNDLHFHRMGGGDVREIFPSPRKSLSNLTSRQYSGLRWSLEGGLTGRGPRRRPRILSLSRQPRQMFSKRLLPNRCNSLCLVKWRGCRGLLGIIPPRHSRCTKTDVCTRQSMRNTDEKSALGAIVAAFLH